jgi:hypothetical protein
MPFDGDETITMDFARKLSAAMLRETIPDGWEGSDMMGFHDLLVRCIGRGLRDEYGETAEYVVQAIHFRWGYMELVDEIVENFRLPRPSGKICATWAKYAWYEEVDRRLPKPDRLAPEFQTLLMNAGCWLLPLESQYPDSFSRPVAYLCAVFTRGQFSQARIDELVPQIADMIAKGASKIGGEIWSEEAFR